MVKLSESAAPQAPAAPKEIQCCENHKGSQLYRIKAISRSPSRRPEAFHDALGANEKMTEGPGWLQRLSAGHFFEWNGNGAKASPIARAMATETGADGAWVLGAKTRACLATDFESKNKPDLLRRPSDLYTQVKQFENNAAKHDHEVEKLMRSLDDFNRLKGSQESTVLSIGAEEKSAKDERQNAQDLKVAFPKASQYLLPLVAVVRRAQGLGGKAPAFALMASGQTTSAVLAAAAPSLGKRLVISLMNFLDVQYLQDTIGRSIEERCKNSGPWATSFLNVQASSSSSVVHEHPSVAECNEIDLMLESAMQELERELGIDLREINVEENDLPNAVDSEVPTASWLQQEWTAAATASPEGLATSVSKKEDEEEGAAASSDDESDMDDIEVN